MSPHSIQSTMSSRSITILPVGRSTGLDYHGNFNSCFLCLWNAWSWSLPAECFLLFFVIRVEGAWHSAFLTAQSPAGGGQGVRHWLHPWPQQQLWELQPTYQSPLQYTFTQGSRQTPWRERYKSGMKNRITHSSFFEKANQQSSRSWSACSKDTSGHSLGNKGKVLLSLSSVWLHMCNAVHQIAFLSTCEIAYWGYFTSRTQKSQE